jgi:hypothetical protein
VVKHVDALELRVAVVAAVLAVATDSVLIAQHPLKLSAHLVTALARLHVYNLERSSRLEAGSKRNQKGGEERRNVRNSVWELCTDKKKMQVAREHLSRTGKLSGFTAKKISTFGDRAKHVGCGRVRSRNACFCHVLVAVRQGQRRDAAAKGEEQHGRCTAGQSNYIRLYGAVVS